MGHLWAVEDPETHYWHARDSSEPAAPDYLALCGESIRAGGQKMLWFDTEAQMRCQNCADEVEAPYRDSEARSDASG
jgi:hypothetical protein